MANPSADDLPAEITPGARRLAAAEFHRLAEVEWFANLSKPSTRRAYGRAVGDFMRCVDRAPGGVPHVTRAHIIAWRDALVQRGLGGSTIRHRLASLAVGQLLNQSPERLTCSSTVR